MNEEQKENYEGKKEGRKKRMKNSNHWSQSTLNESRIPSLMESLPRLEE